MRKKVCSYSLQTSRLVLSLPHPHPRPPLRHCVEGTRCKSEELLAVLKVTWREMSKCSKVPQPSLLLPTCLCPESHLWVQVGGESEGTHDVHGGPTFHIYLYFIGA